MIRISLDKKIPGSFSRKTNFNLDLMSIIPFLSSTIDSTAFVLDSFPCLDSSLVRVFIVQYQFHEVCTVVTELSNSFIPIEVRQSFHRDVRAFW